MMGRTWEVQYFGKHVLGHHVWGTTYTGDSLLRAVVEMWRLKRTYGTVRLQWR